MTKAEFIAKLMIVLISRDYKIDEAAEVALKAWKQYKAVVGSELDGPPPEQSDRFENLI